MPPLRERWQDIAELAMHFLKQAAERCKKTITQIDDDALACSRPTTGPATSASSKT